MPQLSKTATEKYDGLVAAYEHRYQQGGISNTEAHIRAIRQVANDHPNVHREYLAEQQVADQASRKAG